MPASLKTCGLSLAGITIMLQLDDEALAKRLARRYRTFPAVGDPDYQVLVLSSGTTAGGEARLEFAGERVYCADAGFEGEIDLKTKRGRLALNGLMAPAAVDYYLRLAAALLAFEAGGVMLHAAGVQRGEQAAVFFGHSGSGKTTVARYAPAGKVLNDDLLILLPQAEGWMVCATPFTNPTQVPPNAQCALLGGLFRLVQASAVFLELAAPAQAIAELTSSIPVIPADPVRGLALLERLSALNRVCPVCFLHFLPDNSFWPVVDDALKNTRPAVNQGR